MPIRKLLTAKEQKRRKQVFIDKCDTIWMHKFLAFERAIPELRRLSDRQKADRMERLWHKRIGSPQYEEIKKECANS